MPEYIQSLEPRTLLSGNGLAAAYFNSTDFTDLKLARIDSQVSFDGSAGPPVSSLGSDYSIRWSGRVQARYTEQYRFATLTAGGVQLWVNGNLIINDTAAHALKVDSGYINLVAGTRNDIRLEFTTDGTDAPYARLYFQSNSQPKVVISKGDLYSALPEQTAPAAPGGLRTSYVTDTTIKAIWSPVTDASGTVLYDVYVGKTKVATTSSTNYTRSGRAPATAYSFSVRAVDVFGNASGMSSIVVTTKLPVSPAGGNGLAAMYYSGDFSHFWLTRTDSPVNETWNSSPVQSSDGTFSVVWSGMVVPKYTETYTFYVNGNGGDRLFVNNQLLIDHYTQPTGTEDSGTITLTAGKQYAIALQYHNTTGSGNLALEWSSLSQVKQVIPGSQLFAQFVDSGTPSAPGDVNIVSTTTSSVSLDWSASSDDVGVAYYDVYRNSQKIGDATGTSFTDTGLASNTQYAYSVRSIDGAQHTSPASNTADATTQSTSVIRDSLSVISAGSFDSQSGVSSSGGNVTNFDDGDWIRFDTVDFHSGVNSVKITLAVPTTNVGGAIELHLDAPNGTKIGTVIVQATGSYTTYYVQQTEISGASGVHNLYLVGAGAQSLANIQAVQFSTATLVKIMPLGDSITQEFTGQPSWRYYLYQDLLAAGKSVDFVGSQTQATDGYPSQLNFDQNHEGHSGWTTAQILSALPGFLSLNVPDIVLLHIGTNDLRNGVTQQTAINNVSSIIDTLRGANPNIIVLVAQILPIFDVSDTIVQSYNTALANLVASKSTGQSPLEIVDQHTGFNLNTDSNDGLHPNNIGDQKMAGVWDDALEPLI